MAYDFNKIADNYDRLNHLMTMGMDRCWRRRGARWLMHNGIWRPKCLDVAAGTGDLAFEMYRRGAAEPVVCVDLSEKMLEIASSKLSLEAECIVANAESLPFDDGSFDCVGSAFGIRNFVHLEQGLSEMVRVLKPGGRLMILELATPDDSFVRLFYNLYAKYIIPWLGERIAHNREAYTYLPESIERFPKGRTMRKKIENLGCKVRHRKFFFGVCRMYKCTKNE
ncbi:MAG: bifunctional demethylmenaquinone methyltransferase/2-methoxy-6-polyprenyl-1,4-benzoquinol methylase UbiE [Bacteroidales bacterium]|nr:bifunctional demethylmenaquinone methyltransferase/2-methoxy-6-polyprenyl-1,4-benzoquinol methylase UbiE [Bacteroidales bacterium]